MTTDIFIDKIYIFSECYDEERSCGNGSTDSNNSTCISEDLWCNGNVDCPNAADELSCGMLTVINSVWEIFLFLYKRKLFERIMAWKVRCGHDRMVIILDLQLPVQSVPNHHLCCEFKSCSGEVYLIQHYMIKFVRDLRHVGGLLRLLRFPPPIKLTTIIKLKYC